MCFSAPKAPKVEAPAPPPPEVKPLGNEALEKKKKKGDKATGRSSLAIPIGKSQGGSGLGIPRGG
jgi:hypothetical protein